MEQADRRFHTQIRQIEIKARQIGRHAQAFIDIDLIRETADIELFVAQRFDTLFNTATRHIKAALHIPGTPAGWRINKDLFNAGQRGEGDFTQYFLIGRHIAPAND